MFLLQIKVEPPDLDEEETLDAPNLEVPMEVVVEKGKEKEKEENSIQKSKQGRIIIKGGTSKFKKKKMDMMFFN